MTLDELLRGMGALKLRRKAPALNMTRLIVFGLVIGISVPSNALISSSRHTIPQNPPTTDHMTETTTALNPLGDLQEKAASIASSFSLDEDFDPKIRNGHLQSILGFFLRESCSYVPRNENLVNFLRRIQQGFEQASPETENAGFWDERERIDTPDGDWFHADSKYYCHPDPHDITSATAPTVLLLHGLQSSSYGNLAVEMARAFGSMQMNVICLNFRGCSKDNSGANIPNDTLGAYHLGFTKDLLQFLELFRERNPTTPIYLTGFSLGANVVLKCLGDLAEQAPEMNIQGAAVLCAPLDQLKNAPVLARPWSIQRFVYTSGLVKSLQTMALGQLERLQAYDKVSVSRILQAETISEFDDAFIAPIYGYKDCWDYYQESSSIHVLPKIAVPTLILNAVDDPFFDNTVWPTAISCEHGGPAPLKMIQLVSGGHLGFSFHQVDDDDSRVGSNTPSFGSQAAASFLYHVHRQTNN
jgi:predicted alpha/beta-fold hydrolase